MVEAMVDAAAVPVLTSVAALRAQIGAWRAAGDTIALVPTMGALHAGHLALVAAGQRAATRTVATIFVNPTQFGPDEDFARYPRDLARDLATLAEVRADGAFVPSVETMYPEGFRTTIAVAGLSDRLEGRFRPGHFSGVATIVAKLLIQALPDVALFGEKDYQQLQVIRRMARDLDLPTRIEGVSTVREADGLALSSRNRYLTRAERKVAPKLHATLARLASDLARGADAATHLSKAKQALAKAGFAEVQYLELCDAATLEPIPRAERPARLLVAATLGKTRLIDNVALGPG
jgi:pantoate--beta-alanine ligase